jgi:Skp family chaperone for outer membrane proteins
MMRSIAAAAFAAALVSYLPAPAAAQSPDYFIPGQGKPQPAPSGKPAQRPPAQRPAPPAPAQVAPPQLGAVGGGVPGTEGQEAPPQLNVQLPPPPELPALPKGEAPPVAIIGVMGVPEVMRASAAAQMVEKVIGERRAKLNDDAQKEQAVWREMQQSLANERPKLSADQVRGRERELQERITNAQRQFRDRNRIIQEAAQYALAQIERTLIAVIRQVAESRGMNLVLHRAQVALNVNQFDITDQVADQLNKILPSVVIPPDGVAPASVAQDTKAPDAKAPATPPPAPVATTPTPAPAQ